MFGEFLILLRLRDRSLRRFLDLELDPFRDMDLEWYGDRFLDLDLDLDLDRLRDSDRDEYLSRLLELPNLERLR